MFTCLAWKGSVNFKGEIHWSDIYTVHTHVFTIGSRNLDLEIWIWRFGFGDLDLEIWILDWTAVDILEFWTSIVDKYQIDQYEC